MRTTLIALSSVVALAACDTPVGTEIARASAKAVVNDVVETRFPGAPIEPVTDCIIDNASGSEITELAGDAVTGVDDGTIALVLEIAFRPDTISCFTDNAIPLILLGTGILGAAT